jgi:hypothetical protein
MIRVCKLIPLALGCAIIEEYFKINPCGLGLFLILSIFVSDK